MISAFFGFCLMRKCLFSLINQMSCVVKYSYNRGTFVMYLIRLQVPAKHRYHHKNISKNNLNFLTHKSAFIIPESHTGRKRSDDVKRATSNNKPYADPSYSPENKWLVRERGRNI